MVYCVWWRTMLSTTVPSSRCLSKSTDVIVIEGSESEKTRDNKIAKKMRLFFYTSRWPVSSWSSIEFCRLFWVSHFCSMAQIYPVLFLFYSIIFTCLVQCSYWGFGLQFSAQFVRKQWDQWPQFYKQKVRLPSACTPKPLAAGCILFFEWIFLKYELEFLLACRMSNLQIPSWVAH